MRASLIVLLKIISTLCLVSLLSSNAYAEEVAAAVVEDAEIITAEDFLKNLAGKYRGRGEATLPATNRQERLSCNVINSFDDAVGALIIDGKCATTQGRTNVTGKLEMKDGTVVGSFIAPVKGSEITKSRSNYADGVLTVSIFMVNKQSGNLSRTRQIVSQDSEGGFISTFQRFDNASKAYQDIGMVKFSPTEPVVQN